MPHKSNMVLCDILCNQHSITCMFHMLMEGCAARLSSSDSNVLLDYVAVMVNCKAALPHSPYN